MKEQENKAKQKSGNLTEDGILSVKEVSAILRIPASTIYDLAQQGKIRAVKFGRHWRFLAKDVQDHLHGIRNIPKPKDRSDKRFFPRIQSEIRARLASGLSGAQILEGEGVIRDIGEGGVYFELENVARAGRDKGEVIPGIGHPVRIVFEITEPRPAKMELKGRIVHQGHHLNVDEYPPSGTGGSRMGMAPAPMRGHHPSGTGGSRMGWGIKFRHLSKEDQEIIRDYVG